VVSPSVLKSAVSVVGAGLLVAAAARAGACQSPDSLQQLFRLPPPPTVDVGSRVAPAITLGTPAAFGAAYGDAFAGVGFQATTRRRDRPDGGAVVGFGLGDEREAVGVETAFSLFGTVRSCCRGGVSVKVHRLLPARTAVAVGVENGAVWGEAIGSDEATDAGTSIYGVASRILQLRPAATDPFNLLTVTVGVGNGRFRRERDILDGVERVNLFGGASLRMVESLSLVGNWTGQDVVAGLSWVPLRDWPLVVTPGLADLTTRPRFILGMGLGMDYAPLF
jgi:hypothetical protein